MKRKDDNDLNIPANDLKNYTKKGPIEENALKELYQATVKKLDDNYKNRLSLLLYNGNNVDNYYLKRVNLDKVEYKYDKDKLYITLSNFNNKNKSSSVNNISKYKTNNSVQNFTENMSNVITNDTNNINNSEYLYKDRKQRISTRANYEKFQDERFEREINELLLNENKKLSKKLENYIFKKLSQQYNFMKEDKKNPIHNIKLYSNNKSKPFFQLNKIKIKSIDNIKEKTDELRALKSRNHKSYLSPIFFLGKTNDKYIQKISYDSHDKLKKENKAEIINNIKKDNIKYLKIMGKDVNNLKEINKENEDII